MSDDVSIDSFAAPNAGKPLEIFLVFEGGGAKGVVHVGAYHAIVNGASNPLWPALRVKGVGGASVGALIASLIAAGYQPDDLIKRDGTMPALNAELGIKHAEDLFRKGDWKKILRARPFVYPDDKPIVPVMKFLAKSIGLGLLTAGVSVIAFWGIWEVVELFFSESTFQTPLSRLHWAAAFGYGPIWVVATIGWATWLFRRQLKGLASTDQLRELIDKALKLKLIEHYKQVNPEVAAELLGRSVEFRDLLIPLRVTSSDISSGNLRLFTSHENPNLKVSEVVAASIAIPVIFKPVVISEMPLLPPSEKSRSIHHDGGLISNLPVWAFERDRTLHSDSKVVSIEIASETKTEKKEPAPAQWLLHRLARVPLPKKIDVLGVAWQKFWWPYTFLRETILTAIFGGKTLEAREHERLISISLNTSIQLLDFDISKEDRAREVVDAERITSLKLASALCNNPARYMKHCKAVEQYFIELLHSVCSREGHVLPANAAFRIYLAKPLVDCAALKIVSAYQSLATLGGQKFEPLLDDRLILPYDGCIPGLSFKLQRMLIAERRSVPTNSTLDMLTFPSERDRYRRKMMWTDSKWLWAIPVRPDGSSKEPARAVLVIESNASLDLFPFAEAAQCLSDELLARGAFLAAEVKISPWLEDVAAGLSARAYAAIFAAEEAEIVSIARNIKKTGAQ